MNLNPATVAESRVQRSGRPDPELRCLSLPRVRLVVPESDCLGVGRRLAAETATEERRHNHSWHHLYDATADPTTTANRSSPMLTRHGIAQRNNGLTMIKLHPRQSDCARHTYEQGTR